MPESKFTVECVGCDESFRLTAERCAGPDLISCPNCQKVMSTDVRERLRIVASNWNTLNNSLQELTDEGKLEFYIRFEGNLVR